MPEIEAILAIEVFASTIIVLLILYFVIKYRKELMSEKAKEEITKRKTLFRAAFFLGTVAIAIFIIVEIFEALETLDIIFLEEEVEEGINTALITFVLAAQCIMLYLQREVIKHGTV